jgi:hypothetical protein
MKRKQKKSKTSTSTQAGIRFRIAEAQRAAAELAQSVRSIAKSFPTRSAGLIRQADEINQCGADLALCQTDLFEFEAAKAA